MSTSQTQETTTSQTRTFHGSDYRRAAQLLQGFRHVKGNRYQAKDETSQAKVDALAALFASAFQADANECPEGGAPFSAEYFLAGTQVPQAPEYDEGYHSHEGAGFGPDTWKPSDTLAAPKGSLPGDTL